MEEPFPPLSAKIHGGMKKGRKKSNKINGHTRLLFSSYNLAFCRIEKEAVCETGQQGMERSPAHQSIDGGFRPFKD